MGNAVSRSESARELFAVHLLFVRRHSACYRNISLNICREVFTYVPIDQIYLATVKSDRLFVYNLRTNTAKVTSESLFLDLTGTGLTMLSNEAMLIVGGTPSGSRARKLNIWTGRLEEEARLQEGRAWPGVYLHKDWVWVFGGNVGETLDSVECFSLVQRSWRTGPRMLSPKVCFTPCEHRGFIYLPEVSPHKKLLEVLDPVAERYHLLQLELSGARLGSVSFFVGSELVVIDYNRKVGSWRVGSKARQLSEIYISEGRDKTCLTNVSPVRWGKTVFWLDADFNVTKADLKKRRIDTYNVSKAAD